MSAEVQRDHAKLQFEVYKNERANAWFCPSTNDPELKKLALKNLGPAKVALAKFEQENGLGKSGTRKLAEGTVALATIGAVGHFTGLNAAVVSYLPSLSTPAFITNTLSYLPSLPSLPSFTAPDVVTEAANQIANSTLALSEKVVSTAKVVDAIWGVSSLIPSASTLLLAGGSLLAAGLVAVAVKRIFFSK